MSESLPLFQCMMGEMKQPVYLAHNHQDDKRLAGKDYDLPPLPFEAGAIASWTLVQAAFDNSAATASSDQVSERLEDAKDRRAVV
jgi:hypothetical protein